MDRRAAVLALACALGAGGCLRARGTPDEPVVVELRLEGVRAVDEGALRERLATQGSGVWLWNEPHRLDPFALEADRRRIEAFYRAQGHYEARVADVLQEPVGGDPGRVRIVVRVVEGRPVRVSRLVVNGLDAAPEARARAGRLPLSEGDVFTEAGYDATRAALATALSSTGWATAEVTQRAVVLPEAATAEVTYDVSPGRRWRFGPVDVAAGRQLPRGKILDQVLAAITPGDWWDESRLALAQARVFGLGAFGGVRIARLAPDPDRGTIGLVVLVQPAPFRTVRVGPGLGLQAVRWDAHLLAGWQDRNFLGDLRRLSTEVRAGYAWLPNPWRPAKAGPVALLSAEFAQPGAFTRWVDAAARVELERGIEQAFDFTSERLRLSLPLRIRPRWKLVPSYNLELYNLSSYGTALAPGGATSGGATLENCRGSVCLLTYLDQTVAWDGRDDPLNTRRGLYVSLSLQEGVDFGGYGYRYLRFLPEARFFRPLGAQTVLALRGRLGALVPIAESGAPPVVARFTAGGPLSMRGYYNRRLAPMERQGSEWVPVGGNGVVDGTVELRFGISGNLGAAAFLDGGAVSDASALPSAWQGALDLGQVQWAAGLGLRYRTPFGPLRLDVAARLPDRWSTASSAFPAVPFTRWPDGALHREPLVAVHLSLGEAF
jgi:translocation and assembly module TamA